MLQLRLVIKFRLMKVIRDKLRAIAIVVLLWR